MTRPIQRIRKLTRAKAREANLAYYDNGVPCSQSHHPIIRLTKTGGCYQCWKDRRERRLQQAEQQSAFKVSFYLHFKKVDGSYLVVGPFMRRSTAVQRYKQLYRTEYGTECPPHYFGRIGGAEDGNFEAAD